MCSYVCIKARIYIYRDGSKSETREKAKERNVERPQSGGSDGSVDGEQQMMSVDVNEYCSHSARKLKAPPEVAIFVRAVKAAVVISWGKGALLGVGD